MRWVIAVAFLASWPVNADPCVAHHPDPDVAYRPDIDVHGVPLVPVEDPGQNVFRIDPEDVGIPIEVPLREADRPVDDGGKVADFDAIAEVGKVRIEDGIVTFDGEALRSTACQ